MFEFPGVRRLFRLRPRRASDAARDIDDEIETHIALRAEHLMARGVPGEQAWAEARRRFGDWPHARAGLIASAERREQRMRLRDWADDISQDVSFAFRQLRRAPGYAAFAVLTLALAIGLTTAVFAAVDGVLLRALPWAGADRVMTLMSMDSVGNPVQTVSADNWNDWRSRTRAFDGIAIAMDRRFPLLGDEGAFRVAGRIVTPGYFGVIGARLLFGREFRDGDETAAEAVVSEGLWRRVLGARRDTALTLRVGSRDYDVVGVVAAGQEFPEDVELWVPFRYTHQGGMARNNINFTAVGRLKPGVTIEAARADLAVVARGIRETDPAGIYSWGVHVIPLREHLLGPTRRFLPLLLGAAALVLLIACANLASANLARGASRAREMAIRAAVGAGRGRIVRQLLVEHLVLALVGGAAGVFLARGLTRLLTLGAAVELPRAHDIQIDGRVLAFAFVVSAAAGLIAGLLPARQASRDAVAGPLAGGRGTVRGGRGMPGQMLVGLEVALAVMLVAGAGLLVQSFRTLLSKPLGFETRGVAVAEITLVGPRYAGQPPALLAYWRDLASAVRETPGIRAAGVANWIPLGTGGGSFIDIAGRDLPGAGAAYRIVGEGYFDALGIRLIGGRQITMQDDSAAPPVTVINQAMAEHFWPGQNPIGAQVRAVSQESGYGSTPAWRTIVGVVSDVRHWGYDSEPQHEMYVPYAQTPTRITAMHLVVAGTGSGAEVASLVRARIRALDASIAADIEPLADRASRSTADRRFTMSVLSLFGALALVLAGVGVYGVLALSVAQRTRELAVRSALGAERADLLRMVLGAGLKVVAAGAAAGLVGAWFGSRALEAILFEVSPHDPMVFAVATGTIIVAGTLASLIPAARATRVDPMVALQSE